MSDVNHRQTLSEWRRAAIDAGLRALCSETPDFDMSPAMRRAAADFIMGHPGMFAPDDGVMVSRDLADRIAEVAGVMDDGGPHEWGYRDITDGSFIADDWPFSAAMVIGEFAALTHADIPSQTKLVKQVGRG